MISMVFLLIICCVIFACLSSLIESHYRRENMNKVFYDIIRTKKRITTTDFVSICANYRFSLWKKGLIIGGKEAQKFLNQKAKELGGTEISERGTIIYYFESAEIITLMNKVFYNYIKNQKRITAADFVSACANHQFSIWKRGIIIEGEEAQEFLRQKALELGGTEISKRGTAVYYFESGENI